MGENRIDIEESSAWGKGIDYFEYAKKLIELGNHRERLDTFVREYVLCDACKTWALKTESDEILGEPVCLSCYQTIRGDLDSFNEEIEHDRP